MSGDAWLSAFLPADYLPAAEAVVPPSAVSVALISAAVDDETIVIEVGPSFEPGKYTYVDYDDSAVYDEYLSNFYGIPRYEVKVIFVDDEGNEIPF